MERTITATEANREFSRIFREVASGESYVVTAHGKLMVFLIRHTPRLMQALTRGLTGRVRKPGQ